MLLKKPVSVATFLSVAVSVAMLSAAVGYRAGLNHAPTPAANPVTASAPAPQTPAPVKTATPTAGVPDGYVEVALGDYVTAGCKAAGMKDCVPFNKDGKPATAEELAERVLVPLKR